MPTVVVPFRGESAKQRLAPLPEAARTVIAEAMLGDVLAACDGIGRTIVAREGRQGEAVAAALRGVDPGQVLVVNADLPCVRQRDLLALLGSVAPGGIALVEAADGTTNALALADPHLFAPLYGPGSAERFRARAARLGAPFAAVDLPGLADDVDTLADLERLEDRLGPHTAAALHGLRAVT
jgi:2-phospho-L-lactate guanylyltransferase (CobY/MobA/RfbA family)